MWKKLVEHRCTDYDLPLMILGDFYSARKEEQNKFLFDVCYMLNLLIRSTQSLKMTIEQSLHYCPKAGHILNV